MDVSDRSLLFWQSGARRKEVVIIMAVGKDARLTRAGKRPRKSSHKWLLHQKVILEQLRKEMVELRKEANLMTKLLEKDRAKVKEKEQECARRRKWNDLASKQDSCSQRGIKIALEIFDAEDGNDLVKVDELRQSFSELVADHIEDTIALLTGGQD